MAVGSSGGDGDDSDDNDIDSYCGNDYGNKLANGYIKI
jgi:hypothetical protein